jgi:outer membrane lipoprotein-sorting protein
MTTSMAESVLRKMAAKYAALNSYSDTTSVKYRNPDGADGASADCKIAFQRPSFLLIDGQSRRAPDAPTKREVIWSDGKSARSWSTSSAVTILNKIQLAGSKMFGTYAYHIPSLLQADWGGARRLSDLEAPSLATNETIDGVECLHVRGNWMGDSYEVWLGKNDYLVRKIVAIYSGYGMEELHHDITVDQPIPGKTFAFEPEKEVSPPPKKK